MTWRFIECPRKIALVVPWDIKAVRSTAKTLMTKQARNGYPAILDLDDLGAPAIGRIYHEGIGICIPQVVI